RKRIKMKSLKKKTIATLLIAIFMISAFTVAVNAAMYDDIQQGGIGTVELVDTFYKSATHSAKLILPDGSGSGDEARIKFDYDAERYRIYGY
ncbi:unnamed protein product, partial [marine sediment metagenome]